MISDYMTLDSELATMIDNADKQTLINFANDCLRLSALHKEREEQGIVKTYHQPLFNMKSHELKTLSDACMTLSESV